MGGFAAYTYPGGNFQSQTGGGIGGGGGTGTLDDMTAFYKQMAMRRMAQQDEDRQRRMAMEDAAIRRANAPQLGGGYDSLAGLRQSAEAAQLRAALAPPPTKMISGPQIIPGQVMDPMAMNSFQRQMYLPQGSSMTGGPTGQEEARSRRMAGDVELDLATEAEQRRRAMMGGSSGRERADYGSLGSYGR